MVVVMTGLKLEPATTSAETVWEASKSSLLLLQICSLQIPTAAH